MTEPNLFSFATSELSQDAFLCWLLAWADPSHADADPELHAVAVEFVKSLFRAAGAEPPGTARVKVLRQVKKADVVALVGDHHVLVIEDKTGTKNHSNQLERYRKAIGEEFPGREPVCVYLKTGDQSSYADVKERGWRVFTRADLLGVLRRGPNVQNAVFDYFTLHLEEIEEQVQSYADRRVGDWSPAEATLRERIWSGFYMAIQEPLNGRWGYNANQRGGFMWFSWSKHESPDPDTPGEQVCLQIEQDKLVVKVGVEAKADQSRVRDKWKKRVDGCDVLPEFRKPSRVAPGRWMTAAVYEGDYRVTRPDGNVDLEQTVAYLIELTERFTGTFGLAQDQG